MKRKFPVTLLLSALALALTGCASGGAADETEIYFNGHSVTLTEDGAIDLDLLSVEDGITVTASRAGDETVTVNGAVLEDAVYLDITAITREETVEIEIDDGNSVSTYTVNLMPSTFGDYTTEGESQTAGDFYLSTYDEEVNYIFKLNNSGDLIFYKETGDNALDFRKVYNSDGEVRYTYLQYLENSFCGISGINPGCVVVMDEDYNVIDELYYQTTDGEESMVDPHGFIYLDDGHYILTAYEDVTVADIPAELSADGKHRLSGRTVRPGGAGRPGAVGVLQPGL